MNDITIKNTMHKISVITINYNNVSQIRRTLESVSSQTYTNLEWIIIDGGSTDGSVDIIKEYESKITYWVSEPDKGIYNAMNKGVQHATGDYCIFINSGDHFINSHSVEDAVNCGFDTDLAIFNLYVDNSPNLMTYMPKFVTTSYLIHSSIPHESSFMKRELLLCIPYNETLRISADWEFFYDAIIFQHCSYKTYKLPIACFYSDGCSCKYSDVNVKERLDFLYSKFPRKMLEEYQNMNGYALFCLEQMSPLLNKMAIKTILILYGIYKRLYTIIK